MKSNIKIMTDIKSDSRVIVKDTSEIDSKDRNFNNLQVGYFPHKSL